MKQLTLVFFAILLLSDLSKAQIVRAVPNGNFNTWDSVSFDNLDSPWITSNAECIAYTGNPNVTKVTGLSGQAVHLQTYVGNNDTVPGEILNFDGYINGTPYTQSPSGFTGYYRCNINTHDTGYLTIGFIKNQDVYYQKIVPFYGNASSFTRFNIVIDLPFPPDSVTIDAVSGNLANSKYITNGSWLELDDLSFTGSGISQQLIDGNFDTWTTKSNDLPVGWHSPPAVFPNSENGISRAVGRNPGTYCLKMVEEPFPGNFGLPQLTSGIFPQTAVAITGGQPYQQIIDTLTGYYKYTPVGNDSAGIFINLQKDGGSYLQPLPGIVFGPAKSWTYFQFPIISPITPDTMRIDIYSSFLYPPGGGSAFYLDNLQLKSQPLASILSFSKPDFGISAFPDPAQNQLNIRFGGTVPSEFGLKIYNSEGCLLIDNQFNSGSSTITIPINQLSAGLYFYEVSVNGSTVRNKFVKAN